ncbi:MAG: Crp/Fnr family transcriptional regulator [Chitinophagaceae bacterium]
MENKSCDVSSCFLCSHCIPEWRALIAVTKKTIRFKKGEQFFREGEKVTGVYLLYSGSAKVHKRWLDNKELILRFTKPGDMLGHRGLAAGNIFPVSATALEDSTACFIANSFLETILKADHALTYTLMHFYAVELQKAEMRMRNLALMEVNGRIADALVELLNVYGTNKSKFIAVTVTRQDIASYAGTSYETVFKFLRTLTVAKIISVAGKSIRIDNVEKLRAYIGTKGGAL